MTTNSNSESLITNKELRKVFTRSCTLDSAWNYERQQNLMYCYTMLPVLKKLYGDNKEKMASAMQRHLEFMSCTPLLSLCWPESRQQWKKKTQKMKISILPASVP